MSLKFKKKYGAALLILSLVVQNLLFNSTDQVYATTTGTVTATKLNVRSSTSTSSSIVKVNGSYVYLKKGAKVPILSSKGSFYYVSLNFNGKSIKGYVHRDYIKITSAKPTPKPTPKPVKKPTPTPVPKQSGTVGFPFSGKVTASSLVIRSGAGTTYKSLGSLAKNNSVSVVGDTTIGNTKWYKITVKKNNKTITGYVSAYYVKNSYNKALNAQILASKVSVSTKAGSTSYVKNTSKKIISLNKGTNIIVKNETIIGSNKWYQITFKQGNVSYTGYIQANKFVFKSLITPTPTKKPTPTPTKKPTPTPTKKPTPTPIQSNNQPPANAGTIPKEGTVFEVSNLKIYDSITTPTSGYVCNTDFVFNVFGYNTSSKTMSFLNDSNGKPIKLKSAQAVTVTQSIILNYERYYKIDFTYNGAKKTGYVMPSVIYIPSKESPVPTPKPSTPSVTPTKAPLNSTQFEQALTTEKFPESYKTYLRSLHNQYPQWVFKAYHTGLNWEDVIKAENKTGVNLIPNTKGLEWLSMEGSAYNWNTDKFTVYDGSYWVTTSKAALEYYMDPRNFITTNGIFQFELLKYQSVYQDITGVNNILKSTAFDKKYSFTNNYGIKKDYSYAESFIKAALYSGVSPYHLASRSKQEVLSSATSFSGSASGTYSGYTGYYNFYNIGATNSSGGGAIANGLTFAKNTSVTVTNTQYMLPWNDRFSSIVGGAFWIGSRYINRGQDTVYLQKFNVTNISRYSHQYMSNVEAPYAEAKKVKSAYNSLLNTPIVFSIPVYLNMPSKPVPIPAPMKNPNNRIKTLSVKKTDGTTLNLTPTFSQTTQNYNIAVDNKVSSVVIGASAASSKATVSGTGTKSLSVGQNKIVVGIKAENGSIANYTINIERKK